MARSKFLINNYMKDFKYYGLFLTEESKAELKTWLINSNYQPEILKSEKEYLDHCTLLQWKDIEPIIIETKLEKR